MFVLFVKKPGMRSLWQQQVVLQGQIAAISTEFEELHPTTKLSSCDAGDDTIPIVICGNVQQIVAGSPLWRDRPRLGRWVDLSVICLRCWMGVPDTILFVRQTKEFV